MAPESAAPLSFHRSDTHYAASLEPVAQSSPHRLNRQKLLQVLGIGFGITVTVGATVSGGILRSPAEVAALLPNAWMFVGIWIAGGLYAFICSFSFAELSAMMPHSGGLYIFAQRALGDYAGFIVGWTDWLTSCGTVSASALLIADVAVGIFPELRGKGMALAAFLLLVFTLFQWSGIRMSSAVQSSTSFLKSLALFIVAVAAFSASESLFFFHPQAAAATAQPSKPSIVAPATSPTESNAVDMSASETPERPQAPASYSEHSPSLWSVLLASILAFQIVIYMYDGYYGVVYFGEEVRNPARDIPRSMFLSIWITGIIYVTLNLAFVYVMPISLIASSDFIGGAVAKITFGEAGDAVIKFLIIVCELSTINAFFLFATRTLFAMSRDGLFSARAVRISKSGTPTVSLLMSAIVAFLFLLSGTFEKALAVLTFAVVVNYVLSFWSVFVLRRRHPRTERLYKAWGYPWTTGIALGVSILFLVGSVIGDVVHSLYALLALAASYPAYRITRRLLPQEQASETV
jgi:APA family basic amino acid/polyamine antiporter